MLRNESDGAVVRLTIDRPDVRNSFNDELIHALTEAFQNMTESARVVILTGEGKAFSAGGDLNWMRKAAGYTAQENYEDAFHLTRLFHAMIHCPAPIIARVNGAAFGGGCGLVAASDIGIASDKALFAFSEVKLGLVPATISTFVLPKIGSGHARALFTTGMPFDAERALRVGLVHEVVTDEELDAKVDEYVGHILKSGPHAVAASKKLAIEGPYDDNDAATLLAQARSSAEGKEGVAAFLDKRPASFVVER